MILAEIPWWGGVLIILGVLMVLGIVWSFVGMWMLKRWMDKK